MKSLWKAWVQLFSLREPGTSLALFRIALGLCVFYSLVSIAGAGLVPALWTGVEHGGMRALRGNWLLELLGGATPSVVWSVWALSLLASMAFVIGAANKHWGRLLTLVLLLSYNALVTINPFASGAYDVLMTNALWLLVWAEPAATLSLAVRLKGPGWTSELEITSWPRYLLMFQLLLMYTLTGLHKSASMWTPSGGYTALYWVTQDPTWMRFDGELFAWLSPLLRVATALTWHWEQCSILLLLWFYARYTSERGGRLRGFILKRDWRKGWTLVGLSLHVGILLLMNVGPFSWVSMSFYVLLWRHQEWQRFWIWLRNRAGR